MPPKAKKPEATEAPEVVVDVTASEPQLQKMPFHEAWGRVEGARTVGAKPNLSCLDLSGVDFTHTQHRGRMEGLRRVLDQVVIGRELQGCDFSGSNLEGTVLINCVMQGCNFKGVTGTPKIAGADLRWSLDVPAGWPVENGMGKDA